MLDRVESSTIRDYLDGTITPQTLVEQMSTNDHMADLFSAVSSFISTDSTDEEPPQTSDTKRPTNPTWADDDGDFSDETWLEDGVTYD
ncbi:hypothetical protein MOQ72_36025 [Saccharopolyspora sp. K220]|uniref:hypothetical protein n=1 Tax=Saccharopolyspora soli TaxID=2926618 RepID=UPI001F572699|nr:hypothetical protein [Saccharopolyspora soli]MCI2422848.1 hypothetical protein [Saccharopolyspora soli]